VADEVVGQLYSRNRVRATLYTIEVVTPEDQREIVIDPLSVLEITREGTRLKLRRAEDIINLDFISLDEAGTFERGLRAFRSQIMTDRVETIVRTYSAQHDFNAHAAMLAQQGWVVSNVTEHQPATGCARGCLLGPMALVWKPKPELIATYTRRIT
jgi:hypothetical protein